MRAAKADPESSGAPECVSAVGELVLTRCLVQYFKAGEANETAMDSNFGAVQNANLDLRKSGAKIGITAVAFEREGCGALEVRKLCAGGRLIHS
jgi:hypothetical protein